MKFGILVPFLLLIASTIVIQSCSKEVPKFFSIEDEKLLADELRTWASEDTQLILLSETQYASAYAYSNAVLEDLLGLDTPDSASDVANRDMFNWELYLVNSVELNGYVTPAGHIYVTTGLIKLLETPDAFASLIGHLIAHADQRHVTKRLLSTFTSRELLGASKGDSTLLDEIAESVFGRRVAFTFSSSDEQQAERYTVDYLSSTDYACNAATRLHQRLIKNEQQGSRPAFYVLHAYADDRTPIINAEVEKQDCSTDLNEGGAAAFRDFKNSLP